MTQGYNWESDLPYMDVRRFIADRLRQEPPSAELDFMVCDFLGKSLTSCTQDLGAAISMIPEGWWWHISHLEAKVIPTKPVAGAPVSNSSMYDFYGSPVGFSAMCWDRSELPAAVCEALLKARYDLPAALVVEASALAHNDLRTRMQRSMHHQQAERATKPKRGGIVAALRRSPLVEKPKRRKKSK